MSPANLPRALFRDTAPIFFIDRIPSTNQYVREILATDDPYPEGSIWMARSQTHGRGQGDHQWESEPHKNLTFTMLLYPGFLQAAHQFRLSQLVALSVCELLSHDLPDVSVKWPNDIYTGDGKIAGILIEHTLFRKNIANTLVGIGINVNQLTFRSDAPNPVSMSQITGKTYDLEALVTAWQQLFLQRYQEFKDTWPSDEAGADNLHRRYLQRLYRKDCWASYRDASGRLMEGMIVDVTPQGHLEVMMRDHSIRHFDLKEISFVI